MAEVKKFHPQLMPLLPAHFWKFYGMIFLQILLCDLLLEQNLTFFLKNEQKNLKILHEKHKNA